MLKELDYIYNERKDGYVLNEMLDKNGVSDWIFIKSIEGWNKKWH